MSNTNCLDGLKCPNCRSEGPLYIETTCTALVGDDGIEATESHDWEDSSACRCSCCGYSATVAAFTRMGGRHD